MTPAEADYLTIGILVLFGLFVLPAAVLEAAARRWPRVGDAVDRIIERIAR